MSRKITQNINVPCYLPTNSDIDVINFVTCLNYTPICEWYVVKSVAPRTNNAQKYMCLESLDDAIKI